jgi:hypothetical protein
MDPDKGSLVLGADVLELIVDELCDDIPALTACALASSILLPCAQRHLFRGVEIDNDLATRLLDLLDVNEQLEHALKSVHLVGERNIFASVAPYTRPWHWMSNPDRRRLLARLPRLQTLVLAHFQWAEVELERSQELSPSLFPCLHSISFLSCRLPTNAAFVSFLSALPLLRELRLDHCTWISDNSAESLTGLPATIDLNVFEFVYSRQAIGHSWMNIIGAHQLRRLAFTLYSQQDVPLWQGILDDAGATLREVELSMRAEYGESLVTIPAFWYPDTCLLPGSARWPDLGRLAQLRELSILSDADPWQTPRVHSAGRVLWFLSALQSLHSAPLETVKLYMDNPQPEFFKVLDWSVLRRAVDSAGVSTESMVVFVKLDEWCMQAPDLVKDVVANLEECERLIARATDEFGLGSWLRVERVRWSKEKGVGTWDGGIRRLSRRALN